MERLVQSGRVRSIGLSNFNQSQTERILAAANIKPVINQVECHPFKNKRSLIRFSSANNITVTAHTPLGKPKNDTDTSSPITHWKVLNLAKKYNKTPAQIVLHYTVCAFMETYAIWNGFDLDIFSVDFRFKTEALSFRNQRKNIIWRKILTYLILNWPNRTWQLCTR